MVISFQVKLTQTFNKIEFDEGNINFILGLHKST